MNVKAVKNIVLGFTLGSFGLTALAVTIPNIFTSGTVISSSAVNVNFAAVKTAVDALEAKFTTPIVPISPTLQNGWGATTSGSESPSFYKDIAGIVHLQGAISGGTSGTTAFELPAGFRPVQIKYFTIYTNNNTQGSLEIRNNGLVTPIGADTSGYTSLEGVTFRPIQ